MAIRVGVHEAKTQLSKLLVRAENGEDVVIERNGKPVARLVRAEDEAPKGFASIFGIWKDRDVWMSEDFDDPIGGELGESFGWR